MHVYDLEEDQYELRARNPHQRVVDDNIRAGRLSNAGLNDPEAKRKVEDEDPELLYQFDSFYHTTKSLLVLFQVMGVMPIDRSGIGLTTFRWTSGMAIYAYILYFFETVYVTVVFKERLLLILQPGKRFDEYIYAIIFLSILVPHFLLPVASWTNGPEVAKFKNMWTIFQVEFSGEKIWEK